MGEREKTHLALFPFFPFSSSFVSLAGPIFIFKTGLSAEGVQMSSLGRDLGFGFDLFWASLVYRGRGDGNEKPNQS